MCGCKNKTAGSNVRNNLNFRVSNNPTPAVMRFNTEDFIQKYYIGETVDNYIGKNTNINYGKRIQNNKVLVHQSDVDSDSENFSDTLQIIKEIEKEVVTRKKKVNKESEVLEISNESSLITEQILSEVKEEILPEFISEEVKEDQVNNEI